MTANIATPLGVDKTDRLEVRAIIYARNIPQPIMLATRILLPKFEFLMEFNICGIQIIR